MTRRTRYLLVLLAGVVLVNLPLVHWLLRDDSASGAVPGSGRTVLVATLVADVLLAIVALLLWRFGLDRRPQLRAVAMEDVQPSAPGTAFDRIGGETFLVRGEVLEVAADHVVLDLGGRSIMVLLDGYQSPVGPHQPAQVQARLI